MDEKDNKIIDQLKQMPKIEDKQDKTLLFNKINQEIKGVSRMKKRNQTKWILPSIATVAIAALVFIMIQSGIFDQDEVAEQSTDLATRTYEYDVDENADPESGNFNSTTSDNDAEDPDEATESTEEINEPDAGSEEEVMDLENRLVYYNDEHEFPIYTIAVGDQQANYTIPISLIDTSMTGEGNPNDIYNRLDGFVDEAALGVYEYPFDEIEFIFSNNNENITMRVADDYRFLDTSAQMSMFSNIIQFMFADYPATELKLETDSKDFIDLGSVGEQSSLQLEAFNNLAYKIYQFEDKERLLIPIVRLISGDEFFTIDEALHEMQFNQPDYSITGSIPTDVEYTVDPSDEDSLKITFEEDPLFGDNQMTKEMVEAILMTAKSFGFNQVEFDLGGDVTQVNQFDLTKPVQVPDGVNPDLLH